MLERLQLHASATPEELGLQKTALLALRLAGMV
jgi:hypothetical protein